MKKILEKLMAVMGVVFIAVVLVGMFQGNDASATPPKITVGKYVYMTLDPNGRYTNAEGLKYNYVTGYVGFFLRDGIIYFQGVDCSAIKGTTTPFYDQKTGCYYEYGVETDYPRFLYGNATLPSPQ